MQPYPGRKNKKRKLNLSSLHTVEPKRRLIEEEEYNCWVSSLRKSRSGNHHNFVHLSAVLVPHHGHTPVLVLNNPLVGTGPVTVRNY